MNTYWFLLIIPLIILLNIVSNKLVDRSKNYDELLSQKLSEKGFVFLKSRQPKIFDVDPFKKFEVKVKPFINGRPAPYEHTSYRIVTFQITKNKEEEVWVKIDTHTKKKTKIEFKPALKTFKR